MDQVTENHLIVRSAQSPHPWPTRSANLQIVEFWASTSKPTKKAAYWLDGEEVPAIGSDLQPYGRVRGRPQRLQENDNLAFQGSNILGQGFILTEDKVHELLAHDSRNSNVIQPYINGKDLNRRPDCSAGRWVINFHMWSLEEAEEYPDCIDIVRRLVKPARDQNKDKQRREIWWRFTRPAPELYQAIKDSSHTLAIAQVSNTLTPARVPTGQVFDQKCVVFALDDDASLALLSSNIHTTWVTRYTLTLRTDISYSPSDAFLTFPRPQPTAELEALGRQLDGTRRDLMLSRAWGLTKTYNRVHDADNHEPVIQELRDIHVAIDEAVMRAYGWDDLDLKIGHHPTKLGIRWTVSKEARFKLLDLLLEENHKRYALENPS